MAWLKELIGADQVPIGIFCKIPAVETIEILALANFDFVVLDAEHSMLTLSDINHMIAVARGLDMPALVRIADHGYGDLQRILDAGAAGVLFPHVSNARECEKVVRQAIHPPLGTRGSGGGMRAGGWGFSPEGVNYTGDGLGKVMRIPMIEEKGAVEAADEILAVDGVDGVFIGPGDLSMTMGVRSSEPSVQEAIQKTFTAAKAHGVPAGTVARNARDARRLIDRGYDFLMLSNDTGLLRSAAVALVTDVRS